MAQPRVHATIHRYLSASIMASRGSLPKEISYPPPRLLISLHMSYVVVTDGGNNTNKASVPYSPSSQRDPLTVLYFFQDLRPRASKPKQE